MDRNFSQLSLIFCFFFGYQRQYLRSMVQIKDINWSIIINGSKCELQIHEKKYGNLTGKPQSFSTTSENRSQ